MDGEARKHLAYRCLSRVIFWIGLAVLAILALPAGIIVLAIRGVWTVTDRLTGVLERKGDE